MAEWLQQCGVYWIPLFQILEARGLEVCLVNARHVKNVPGRRTDVSDCQWLQFLHAVGLLRASYRPEQEVCAIGALLRHRESLVQMAATHVHHMQKALDQMNLHHVISDLTGQTGRAMIQAILGGERDPYTLAKLRNERIQASEDVIAKALVGDYRAEHLFALRQSWAAYQSYQKLLEECDREIRRWLEEFPPPNSGRAGQANQRRAADAYRVLRQHPALGTPEGLRGRSHEDPWHPHRTRANPIRRDRSGLHQVPERFGLCFLDGSVPG